MPGLTDILLAHVNTNPEKEMLVGDGGSTTYKEGFDRIGSLIQGFKGLGLKQGDRLALMMHNQPEYVETYLACMLMGITPVFVGYKLRGDELIHILSNATPKAIVVDGTLMERVLEVQGKACGFINGGIIVTGKESPVGVVAYEGFIASNPPSLDTLAEEGAAPMIYTSGTTGRPKGAFREKMSEGNIFLVMNAISEYGYTSNERHLVVCPLYHSAPFLFATLTLAVGGTLVLMRQFDPEGMMALLKDQRITSTFVVPTVLNALLALPEATKQAYKDLPDLRIIICAGAPLFPKTKEGIINWLGEKLSEFYGSTEAGINIYMPPNEMRSHIRACGRPFPGNELKILDENGNECQPGTPGELFMKNPWMIDAYYKDEEGTRRVFRNGLISVGDVAIKDEDGYYTIVDRKTDMVISGGVNVYPVEVEQAILLHPNVLDAAVIGIPDAYWGERVAAVVVLKEGRHLTQEELVEFLKERLADYKVPKEITFVKEIPHNPQGKTLKTQIKEAWIKGAPVES
jgi:fatty-acyl-CoA synthase